MYACALSEGYDKYREHLLQNFYSNNELNTGKDEMFSLIFNLIFGVPHRTYKSQVTLNTYETN